ncbi:MAG: peptidyl-prolyl cis-trans isomerase, partial [Dorea sp.]
ENGCYVAKLVSTFDKDATETKKASMIEEKKSEYCDEVIDGWKEEAKINVDKKVWEKIDFKTLQVTIKQEEETEE